MSWSDALASRDPIAVRAFPDFVLRLAIEPNFAELLRIFKVERKECTIAALVEISVAAYVTFLEHLSPHLLRNVDVVRHIAIIAMERKAYAVSIRAIERYLTVGGAIDAYDDSGFTLLMRACLLRATVVIAKLLHAGASVSLPCRAPASLKQIDKYIDDLLPYAEEMRPDLEREAFRPTQRTAIHFAIGYRHEFSWFERAISQRAPPDDWIGATTAWRLLRRRESNNDPDADGITVDSHLLRRSNDLRAIDPFGQRAGSERNTWRIVRLLMGATVHTNPAVMTKGVASCDAADRTALMVAAER